MGFDVMRRSASSDRMGRFFFAGLDEGEVTVRVAVSDSRVVEQEVSLTSGKHVTDVVLALPGGEALRGRVIDAASRAGIADALVVLTRPDGAMHGARRARCDEAGEFVVAGLAAGEWTVHAQPMSPEHRPPAAGGAAETPVYGSLRRAGVVADGTYLELPLPRLDVELHGSVLDARGTPAAQHFVVRLVDGEPAHDPGTLTEADGRFTLRVPSGTPIELAAYATARIAANDPITVLDLQMGRRVLLADGPIARAAPDAVTREVTLRLAPR
jgi:hypothetical protein